MMNKDFTSDNASNLASHVSKGLGRGLYVVSYLDAKTAKIVLNVYTPTDENVSRISRQIKLNKAAVHCGGRLLDDSQFTGA